jgi:hypothetical protein
VTKFDKPVPKVLDAITDLVLAFRPKPNTRSSEQRIKKSNRSRVAKVHSSRHAEAYCVLGWTLKHEFRESEGAEPYEYLLVWDAASEPVSPSKNPADWTKAFIKNEKIENEAKEKRK